MKRIIAEDPLGALIFLAAAGMVSLALAIIQCSHDTTSPHWYWNGYRYVQLGEDAIR